MINPNGRGDANHHSGQQIARRHEEENRDSHQSEVYFSGLQGTGQGSGSHHQESDAEPEYQLRAASRKKCRKELKINAVDKQISSGLVRSVC